VVDATTLFSMANYASRQSLPSCRKESDGKTIHTFTLIVPDVCPIFLAIRHTLLFTHPLPPVEGVNVCIAVIQYSQETTPFGMTAIS
ncbi:MAG: hypothetical protein OXC95_16725, partial [Dehalococcoidia bacterium]|nr:hypothetical protein [Dehalococcoidia bacterium]